MSLKVGVGEGEYHEDHTEAEKGMTGGRMLAGRIMARRRRDWSVVGGERNRRVGRGLGRSHEHVCLSIDRTE